MHMRLRRSVRLLVNGSLLVGLVPACGSSGGGSVVQPDTTTPARVVPPALYSVGLAFDERRGRAVLFGGFSNGVVSDATWEWTGTTWSKIGVTGPPGRNSPALAFDSRRGRTVMFGGDASS